MNIPKLASGYTKTTTVPLYWVEYGEQRHDSVLVLHGGPGAHHDYLLPQMLELAKHRRLLFYDQRGGGESRDDSREPVTWRTHVEDLNSVLAEFGMTSPTVIGYSWGGLLALLHALEAAAGGPATHLPSRLVLINPAPASITFRAQLQKEFAARQQSPELLRLREELNESSLRDADPALYRKRLFDLSVAPYFFDPLAAAQLTQFRVTGRVQESVWQSLGDYDVFGGLHTLNIPSLVVHGRDDPIPLQSSVEVAEGLRARLLVLEKCGHVPYVEQPRALFDTINTFLDNYDAQKRE